VRDVAVQKREGDLAVATFGRGFYVLDDLTALRRATPASLDADAILFPVRRPLLFMPEAPLGIRGKAFQGDSFFTAPNPPFGAVITWYLKDEIKSMKKSRQGREKDLIKGGKEPDYPTPQALRAEAQEEEPAIVLTVTDAEGGVVRRLKGPVTAGIHRIAWDLRYPPATPTSLKPREPDPFIEPPSGPMVVPGRYSVSMEKVVQGRSSPLAESQAFEARGSYEIPAADGAKLLAFERKVSRLQRAVTGAVESVGEARNRIAHIKQSLLDTLAATPSLWADVRAAEAHLAEIEIALKGDAALIVRNEPTPPAILDRVQSIVDTQWNATSAPTATSEEAYAFAAQEFKGEINKLRQLVLVDLKKIEDRMEATGAPWTPGRIPIWQPE